VPAINIDGFLEIDRIYEADKKLEYVRKNMRVDAKTLGTCQGRYESQGVDLNRNYAFKYGLDDIGSSPDPCDEQFRGSGPFSEPETQAVKSFLDSHPDVKIAINIHAWGNLLITPYNYDSDRNNPELLKDPMNVAYEDLHQNSGLPDNNLYGSGI